MGIDHYHGRLRDTDAYRDSDPRDNTAADTNANPTNDSYACDHAYTYWNCHAGDYTDANVNPTDYPFLYTHACANSHDISRAHRNPDSVGSGAGAQSFDPNAGSNR